MNYDDFTLDFDISADTVDAVVMNIHLNHDWDGITPIEPHLHWFQNQNKTPNWLIGYRWHQNGQDKIEGWTLQKVVDLGDNDNAFAYIDGTILQISSFGSISPPATPTGVSSILQLKLMRDAGNLSQLFGTDPYSGDAQALSLDIHIKSDTQGSREEYSKENSN